MANKPTIYPNGVKVERIEFEDGSSQMTSGGSGAGAVGSGLYPMTLTSADIGIPPAVPANDTYALMIARWDAAFTSGANNEGVTVTKEALTGTTNDGNTIYSYTFAPRHSTHSVIIVAGLHGNERGNEYTTIEIAQHYYNRSTGPLDQIRSDTTLIFIPILNPDGFDTNSRTNNVGTPVDINRNWDSAGVWSDAWENWATGGDNYKGASAHSEVETIALKTLIDGTAGLTGILDLHTYGSPTVTHCGIIPPAANEPNCTSGLMWAAIEAFGTTASISPDSRGLEPPPWMINYASGQGLWAAILELGEAEVDIQTPAQFAEACNWIGNSIMTMAKLPPQSYTNTQSIKSYMITEGAALSLPTPGDGVYRDLVKATGTTGVFTVDTANDEIDDVGHGRSVGDALQVSSTTTLPAGLAIDTTYWVREVISSDAFTISETGPRGSEVDITDAGTGTHTWELVVDYGLYVPINFVGLAIASWDIMCYPGGSTGDQQYFRPYCGQNVGSFGRENSILKGAEEMYSSGNTSLRTPIHMQAMRQCYPSERGSQISATTEFAWRVQTKQLNAPTGTPVLYRFNAHLTLIPAYAGASTTWYEIGTSALAEQHPIL